MFCRNSLIGTVFPPIPLVNEWDLQYFCIGIFVRRLSRYVYIVREIYTRLWYNCILRILYAILYYVRGSDFCAAVVKLYRTYSLRYLLIRVGSDLCATLFVLFRRSDANIPRGSPVPARPLTLISLRSRPPSHPLSRTGPSVPSGRWRVNFLVPAGA